MKKIRLCPGNMPVAYKMLMKMKLTVFLILITFLGSIASESYSQSTRLTLNIRNSTVKEILGQIEDQSEFRFFYSDRVDVDRVTSISQKNKRIFEILDELFDNTGVTYEVRGRQIALSKDEEITNFSFLQSRQQPNTVTGTVTDENGEPLPGVTVMIKGTMQGTITNIDGNYTLQSIPAEGVLVFSFVGMRSQEIEVGNQTSIDVSMVTDAIGIDEVVAIGYGVTKKSDLTGSITTVKSEDLENVKMQSIDQGLVGRAAGVQVISSSGVPGSAPAVRIRGTTSLQGANEPLYVIDGFPIYAGGGSGNAGGQAGSSNISGISSINPNDIASIEILKDASATAIYGARAANGVVLITTKSGSIGNDKISFSANYGFQNITQKLDMMDAYNYALLQNEAVVNDGGAAIYSDEDLAEIQSHPELATNWQDEVFVTAPTQEYNIAFTGGDKKTNYAITGGYLKQDGIVKNTDFERFTARLNLSRQMNNWLKAGTHITANRIFSNQQNTDAGNVIRGAQQFNPIFPIYEGEGYSFVPMNDGGYTDVNDGILINNPVATVNEVLRQTQRNGILGDIFVEIKLTPHLIAKVTGGANISNVKNDTYLPMSTREGVGNSGVGTIAYNLNQNWLNENTLSYINDFGEHSVSAVVGATFQENYFEGVSASSQGYTNDILQENNLDGGEVYNTPYSSKTRWGLISYLGRVNYSYKSKYLATIAGRIDGSSRFGADNKYAFFPSGSIAWRASEEEFIKNLNVFSNLKIRGSFGYTGNQEIGLYNSLPTTGTQTYTWGDGSLATGVSPNKIPNPGLKWEKTGQFDFGVDFGFFNNRLGVTVDYYHKKTTQMLYSEQVPYSSGFTNFLNNIGSMQNKGIELEIRGDIFTGDFKWDANFNLSANRNKVLSLAGVLYKDVGATQGDVKIDNWLRRIWVGESIGAFFGWQFDGIFQNQDEVDAHNQTIGNAWIGGRRYKDVSSEDDNPEDGKYTGAPDGIVDNADRQIIGNALPDFIGGMNNNLSYKNFNLNVFFQWSVGNDIFSYDKTQLTLPTGGQNVLAYMTDRWTSSNPSNVLPKATTNRQIVINDYYVEDGSYLKIKNILLGYTFPQSLIRGIDRLNVYCSLNNFITFTKYSGYDPEVSYRGASNLTMGEDYSTYPQSKTVMFGVKIDF
ncbi:SusC/RagA family TonB-linked outer membrane protein [Maribellus comscasis]|uniref:SusC/RagA family TonB-linked outer membrane protein n=1 Tax=Maribellus comscasis TaxID=2681766 RepID=A0A6I6K0T9_9BACT|nr:SusC/RagA family TonB-linked outer membrane protein [Maribellus comscasis]QGY43514.1 SusC/RagA family TonB-linked outer membrane protein [Maribellus comscasis]